MITSKDRSGYFGASDTEMILTKFYNKSFMDWWDIKTGKVEKHYNNLAMQAGTIYEHPILDKLALERGINMELDKQVVIEDLKLRVNLDGNDETTIYECKTRKAIDWKMPQKYINQVRVQMFATGLKGVIVDYLLTDADYEAASYDRVLEIDIERITLTRIEQDERWLNEVYLPRLTYLSQCLKENRTPSEEEFCELFGNHEIETNTKNEVKRIPNEEEFNTLEITLKNIYQQQKILEEQKKKLEELIVDYMDRNGIQSYENDVLRIAFVQGEEKSSVDIKLIKALYPDIAQKCVKTIKQKSYIRVTMKR